jgi:hypothetical protein
MEGVIACVSSKIACIYTHEQCDKTKLLPHDVQGHKARAGARVCRKHAYIHTHTHTHTDKYRNCDYCTITQMNYVCTCVASKTI